MSAVQSTSVGWLYHNPDTGIEHSARHPIESGEVPDAECVEEATAELLLEELLAAWALERETQSRLVDLEDGFSTLLTALIEARVRLRDAGMLGGDDDPVNAAIAKAEGGR